MTRRIRLKALVFLCMLSAVLALSNGCGGKKPPDYADDLQFTAVITMADSGGTVDNKLYFKRDMQRIEMLPPAQGTVIIRMDQGRVMDLMPTRKKYVENILKPENKNPLIYEPDKIINCEELGTETIDGHPVTKNRMTIQNEETDRMDIILWFATDLNWPLKASAADGSWTISLRDFKLENLNQSLFEPPSDYQKYEKPKKT